MRFASLLVAAGVLAMPVLAHADLLGDTVHVVYAYPDQGTAFEDLGNMVVPGSGTVYEGLFPVAMYSVSANQIVITSEMSQNFAPADFNGFEFTDISRDPLISNVSIDPLSTFTDAAISFTSNGVFINFQGDQNVPANVSLILDLGFGSPVPPPPPPSSVTPEPSSVALLGTGLLGIAGTMRRRFVRG